MVAGELVAEGTPGGIKSQQSGHLMELMWISRSERPIPRSKADRWRVSLFGDRLHVITMKTGSAKRSTIDKLTRAGIQVREAREDRYSLEDVFIVVVEKARQEGKVAAEE